MSEQNDSDRGCAVVTGGSRGLGAAIATLLAADGWPVVITYRSDRAAADATVATIAQDGGRASAIQADATDRDAISALFEEVESRHGHVAVLVNNAGLRADGLSLQLRDEQWSEVLETNLSAAFYTTRRALRGMTRRRFGRVINIASIVGGSRANVGQSNYAASKAGLIAFTKTVAVEVARRNVTVNAIAPGLIRTDMTQDVIGAFESLIPARRAGSPQEVAACVRFLASLEASYVTGSVLTVDGGLSA